MGITPVLRRPIRGCVGADLPPDPLNPPLYSRVS